MAIGFCDDGVTTQLQRGSDRVGRRHRSFELSGCFTSPSMTSFVTLMAGWVLDLRRHTVTEVIRSAGAVGHKHISSYQRFFSRARWTTDEVGLALAALVIQRWAPKGVIRLVVDDTLGRHTGKSRGFDASRPALVDGTQAVLSLGSRLGRPGYRR